MFLIYFHFMLLIFRLGASATLVLTPILPRFIVWDTDTAAM